MTRVLFDWMTFTSPERLLMSYIACHCYIIELHYLNITLTITRYVKSKAVPLHAMVALGGRWGIAPIRCDHGTRWGKWSAWRPGRVLILLPIGWDTGLDAEALKNLMPLPRTEPWSPSLWSGTILTGTTRHNRHNRHHDLYSEQLVLLRNITVLISFFNILIRYFVLLRLLHMVTEILIYIYIYMEPR
jgi:hypothetical protein